MSNESIVTQWEKSCGLWKRQIGTQDHPVILWAKPKNDSWSWHVWSPQGGDVEGHTPTATLPDTKDAATEAGYALLKRLESGS